MFYIGIDQHKRFSQVAVMNAKGNVVDQCKLPHDSPEVIHNYLKRWSNGTAVLEATRNWDWLYEILEEELEGVKMSHPSRTRLIAEAKIKTDKVDARVLAHLLRTGFLPEAYAPGREVRDGRELHRYRIRLVRIQTMLKNRIHALLDRQNIQHSFTDLFGKKGRAFLEQLELRPPYDMELPGMLRLLDALAEEVRLAMREIRRTLHEDPRAALLMTAPGIGEVTAFLILYEMGDIARFTDARHFASYCALVPGTRQSADHIYQGHTDRNGNLHLKWAFVEAAHKAKQVDPALFALYEKLRRKKGGGKAMVAVAHKLAISAFHVLKKGEPYKYRRTQGWNSGKPADSPGRQ